MTSENRHEIPHRDYHDERTSGALRFAERLIHVKATRGVRSPHFWIILGLLAVFGYLYYAVLTTFHDVYVLLFFYPLIYAAIVYRLRGVIISGLVYLGILLPHALMFAPAPYAPVRAILFALFAFLVSGMAATLLNYLEGQVEAYKEIVSLNDELNSYIARLKNTQKQLIQSEKMNALGQLSAAIAHEINNPLGGALVYTKLLEKKVGGDTFSKEEALSNLTKIEAAVDHCSKLVRGLLDFSRQTEPALKPVKVSEVIDRTMSLIGHQAGMNKVNVIREEAEPVPLVFADTGQIQQVFINLMVNAIQAMPGGGELTIRSVAGEDNLVQVSFRDTGCGIAPEHMDKLFTPFFTTKDEVKGVGLGLSVSYGIIERHGGSIEVQSEPGKGSTFTVRLPAYRPENDQPAQPA